MPGFFLFGGNQLHNVDNGMSEFAIPMTDSCSFGRGNEFLNESRTFPGNFRSSALSSNALLTFIICT